MWPSVVKVVKYWEGLCKSKRPANKKSYDTLVTSYTDLLIPVKFQFFRYVASLFQEFLVTFQTNKPMIPFLAESLVNIFRNVFKIYLKRDVVSKADTTFCTIRAQCI